MSTNQSSSAIVAIARLFWIFAGPALLFILAYYIAHHDVGWLAPASVAFLAVLVALIVARWVDVENSYGDPTTPAEIRKFTAGAIGIGLVGWVIANVL